MSGVAGSCGKILRGFCYPDFEDDFCATCNLNGYNTYGEDEFEE